MFTISVETHFWASHQLALSDSSKESMHNHNWSVTADVSSDKLNSMGFVMDFNCLKAMLDEIVAEFNGAALDKTKYFKKNNSSAENVAACIYEKLHSKLPKEVKLRSIRIVEEPGCSAIFAPDEPGN